MATVSVSGRTSRPVAVPGSGDHATRVVVAVLGALVGLAGIEHGVGEVLQGPVRPAGLFEVLVVGLMVVAFGGFALALVAARGYDRVLGRRVERS
jgi:hypothetical protein